MLVKEHNPLKNVNGYYLQLNTFFLRTSIKPQNIQYIVLNRNCSGINLISFSSSLDLIGG